MFGWVLIIYFEFILNEINFVKIKIKTPLVHVWMGADNFE